MPFFAVEIALRLHLTALKCALSLLKNFHSSALSDTMSLTFYTLGKNDLKIARGGVTF